MGYVHLDIKPDNILLCSSDLEDPLSSLVALIDFSAAQRYLDTSTGEHKSMNSDTSFTGNLPFSSYNQMINSSMLPLFNVVGASRKNDLIAVFYMLICFTQGSLPWWQFLGGECLERKYNKIKDQKKLFSAIINLKANKSIFQDY